MTMASQRGRVRLQRRTGRVLVARTGGWPKGRPRKKARAEAWQCGRRPRNTRFFSYLLDEKHLMAAARYVELNPVSARIVKQPEEYAWSSTRFHLGKRRTDPLVEDGSLSGTLSGAREWRRFLSDGVEEIEAKRIEARMSSGLPLGTEEFVKGLEEETGRVLVPQTGGWPKGRSRKRRGAEA